VPRVVEPDDAGAFWEGRYAQGRLYGTEPTSAALRLALLFRRERVASILEAGCGSGRDALFYAREGFAVTGLDLSQSALRWAQERAARDGLEISLFDAEDIAALFPPDRFDLLTCEVVDLHEVPDGGPVTHREWLTIARKIRAC